MTLPSNSPSPFQPHLTSSPSQVSLIPAEYPIVDLGIGEHIAPPRPGVTYSRVTLLVPSDRQLFMLPRFAPVQTSTIAQVIIPPNRDNYGVINAGEMPNTTLQSALPSYSEAPSTIYEEPVSAGTRTVSEILAIPGQIGNTTSGSYSSHKGKEVEPSAAAGAMQQQQESGRANSTASVSAESKIENEALEPGVKIKKPSNAFILFRSAYTARHKAENKQAKDISVIASHIWKDMTSEEKRPYREKGAEERREHNRKKELQNQVAKRRKMQNKRPKNATKPARGRSKSDTTAAYSRAKIVANPVLGHGGGNNSSGGNASLPQFLPAQPANIQYSLYGLETAQFTPGMHIGNHFTHMNPGAPDLFNVPTIMTADSSVTQPAESSVASVMASLPIFSGGPAVTSVAVLSSSHSPIGSLAQHYYPLQSQSQMGFNQCVSNSSQQSWDELSVLLGSTQTAAPLSSVGGDGAMSMPFGEQNLQQLANSVIGANQSSYLPHVDGSMLPILASPSGTTRNTTASTDIGIASATPDIEILDTSNPFSFATYTTPRPQ